MSTEPQADTLNLQKESPETQSHIRVLMKEIDQLGSPEFNLKNLSGLFKAEAYMTADLAQMNRQLPDKEKDFIDNRLTDYGDNLSMVWMNVATIAKKAEESGLTGLTDEELSLLGEGTAMMYCAYVLPKIIVGSSSSENFGINKVIKEIYQQGEKLKLTNKAISLFRPRKVTPMQIETYYLGYHYHDNVPSRTATPEDLGRVLRLIGNDEGLALLAKTKENNLQIARGDSRGDNTHGWAVKVWMEDKGILYEGLQDSRSGGTNWGKDLSTTKKFIWEEKAKDFVSSDGQKLIADRSAEHFPHITGTPTYFAGEIISTVTVR